MIIAVVLAIVAVCVSMVFLNLKTVSIEQTQLKQISAGTTERKLTDQRIDNIITIHNATVEHYDDEIDQIVKRLNEITADIQRLDAEMKYQQTRMNTVYPWFENSEYGAKANAGVKWANDIKCGDDNDE
jgi:signal transduction histidine kinase